MTTRLQRPLAPCQLLAGLPALVLTVFSRRRGETKKLRERVRS